MTFPTLTSVLATITADPGRPRLTWYGDDGERVELSGAVLTNWVTKAANLLLDEVDAGPGTVIGIDLPQHWRTVVWTMAAWRTGAAVLPLGKATRAAADDGAAGTGTREGTTTGTGPREGTSTDDLAASGCELVVTSNPDATAPAGVLLVAQPLPALARSFAGLPTGAIDAGAAVMTYGDVLGPVRAVDPDAAAIVTSRGETALTHRDLVVDPWPQPHARLLVPAAGPAIATVVDPCLRVLAADGSVVLLSRSAGLSLDTEGALDRLVASERITQVHRGSTTGHEARDA